MRMAESLALWRKNNQCKSELTWIIRSVATQFAMSSDGMCGSHLTDAQFDFESSARSEFTTVEVHELDWFWRVALPLSWDVCVGKPESSTKSLAFTKSITSSIVWTESTSTFRDVTAWENVERSTVQMEV